MRTALLTLISLLIFPNLVGAGEKLRVIVETDIGGDAHDQAPFVSLPARIMVPQRFCEWRPREHEAPIVLPASRHSSSLWAENGNATGGGRP